MKKLLKMVFVAAAFLLAAPKLYAQISIGISISANIAPPALPVYVQPVCPQPDYIWTPGYWAWDPDAADYYWVPGVWVAAPQPGYLWTPAYWGYVNGAYGFHTGYWGPHIGFYGGINYGGGYGGVGFVGGNWSGGHFRYNTAVVNVNTTVIHNTYIDKTVIVNNNVSHNSFNGPGGVQAQPRPEELAAMKEHHVAPTGAQQQHIQTAHQDKSAFSKSNGGHPANVAMNKVGGSHFNAQGSKAPRTNNNAAAKPAIQHNDNANKPAGQPEANRPEANKPEAKRPAAQSDANKPAAQRPAQASQQHTQTHTTQTHTQHVQRSAPKPRPAQHPKEEKR